MARVFPKLHNAMWPGLVGKGSPDGEPCIGFDEMLALTTAAEVNGQKFQGVDLFLFDPHISIHSNKDELRFLADRLVKRELAVGSLVAPVWAGTGGGSAMGSIQERRQFVAAVREACRIAKVFNEHGVRQYGVIRVDTATPVAAWLQNPVWGTKTIASTFREAGMVAAGHGERLAAEGEICWGGLHSWKDTSDLLEAVDLPGTVGFQADQAHIFQYLMGYNAPEHALLPGGYTHDDFHAAYRAVTKVLRPWMIDFHVSQNDGTVHGSGTHDKTGRHCLADDPLGKYDITTAAGYWLENAWLSGLRHICWDGCMFSNADLRNPKTWNAILGAMIKVRDAHGWEA